MELTRRTLLRAGSVAIPASLAGCSSGGTNEQGAGDEAVTVSMKDTTFGPVQASVEPGGSVEWINEDPIGHDVKSAQFHDAAASWDFQSDTLSKDESTSYTFESAGVYEYYCTIHGESNMCGVVLVGDASLSKSLPCGGGGNGGSDGGDGGGNDGDDGGGGYGGDY